MYKKDLSNKIAVVSMGLYVCSVLGLHFTLKPLHTIRDDFDQLEEAVVNENWKGASEKLTDIRNEWEKYEILVRITTHRSISDDFEQQLNECEFLLKQECDLVLVSLTDLKDDLEDVTSPIPSP